MMLLGGNSAKSIDLMQRAMGASTLRSQVLVNNIANASTPNYKRHDVTFQAELERALNSEKEAPGIPFKMSSMKHMPSFRVKDYREVDAKITTDYNTYYNNDGNSVNIETEMMEEQKNTMYFTALAQRTAKEFSKIKYILRSSNV